MMGRYLIRIDCQRTVDLILAVPMALVALPLSLLIAGAVMWDSRGPILYGGTRVGLGEQPFRQWKFRTMLVGSDRFGWETSSEDTRVTRVGRFLRRTSLDEIPQLWNILRGEMSIVGPRPAPLAQLDLYTPAERALRASVRPGLTGLAQVRGRSALSFAEKTSLDIEYVEARNILLDLRIIVETARSVVLRRDVN